MFIFVCDNSVATNSTVLSTKILHLSSNAFHWNGCCYFVIVRFPLIILYHISIYLMKH